MANRNLLKEAIADAKAVKEVAIANAKAALEEAFTPHLKTMLSQKIQEMDEIDEEKEYMTKKEKKEGDDRTSDNKAEAETMKMRKIKEEDKDEVDLDELLAELELDENARTDAEEEGYKDGMKDEKEDMQNKPKKEGRMKMAEVLKEAERCGELAKRKVESKVYERAIEERKRAMSINEDESLTEFINQEAIKEVEKEIKELEKKLMESTADINNMG